MLVVLEESIVGTVGTVGLEEGIKDVSVVVGGGDRVEGDQSSVVVSTGNGDGVEFCFW